MQLGAPPMIPVKHGAGYWLVADLTYGVRTSSTYFK